MHAGGNLHAKKPFCGSAHERQLELNLIVPLADIKFLSLTDHHWGSWPLQFGHASTPFTLALAGYSRWEKYRLITSAKVNIFILHRLPIFPITPSTFLQMFHAEKLTFALQRRVLPPFCWLSTESWGESFQECQLLSIFIGGGQSLPCHKKFCIRQMVLLMSL